MKAFLCLMVSLGLSAATHAMAQGSITFRNSPLSAVIDGSTGLPAASGVATAGLYFTTDLGAQPDPSQPTDAFMLVDVTPIGTGGLYNGGIVTLPGVATGSQVLLQVRGWSAAYASYADAVSDTGAGALVGASNLIGPVAVGQSIDLGTLVQGFTLTPVPEPSFTALALLAALGGARRFFRKRHHADVSQEMNG